MGITNARTGTEEGVVSGDPQAGYIAFMKVAENWLEDCGVRQLHIAGRARAVDLWMGVLASVPIPDECGHSPTLACPKRKPPTYISLNQDGSLTLHGSAGKMPTSVANPRHRSSEGAWFG